jgi:hypothetical protein
MIIMEDEDLNKLTKAQLIEKVKNVYKYNAKINIGNYKPKSGYPYSPKKHLDDMIVLEYDEWRLDLYEQKVKDTKDLDARLHGTYVKCLYDMEKQFISDFQETDKIDTKVAEPFRARFIKLVEVVKDKKKKLEEKKLKDLLETIAP